MGRHHARVVAASGRASLETIVDQDATRAQVVAETYGGTPSSDPADAFGLDLVILATPTERHFELATKLVECGVPLLIEKPVTSDVGDTEALIATAERLDLPVTCGFVERFNPAIRTAESLLDGPVLHAISIRHSPPQPRITADVVDDLLIHDIDLATRLMGSDPGRVAASGWHDPASGVLELVDCVLSWDQGLATLSADRHSQRKVRSLSVTTPSLLIELDLLRQDVTVYRHVSHEVTPESAAYRAETIVDIPFVRNPGEPLALQFDNFLDIIEGRGDASAERRSILAPHRLAARVKDAVKAG